MAISKKKFSVGDLRSELNQTVDLDQIEQVLKQLEEDGWIEKGDSSALELWQSGPLARKFGNMVKYSRSSEGIIPVLPDERDY